MGAGGGTVSCSACAMLVGLVCPAPLRCAACRLLNCFPILQLCSPLRRAVAVSAAAALRVQPVPGRRVLVATGTAAPQAGGGCGGPVGQSSAPTPGLVRRYTGGRCPVRPCVPPPLPSLARSRAPQCCPPGAGAPAWHTRVMASVCACAVCWAGPPARGPPLRCAARVQPRGGHLFLVLRGAIPVQALPGRRPRRARRALAAHQPGVCTCPTCGGCFPAPGSPWLVGARAPRRAPPRLCWCVLRGCVGVSSAAVLVCPPRLCWCVAPQPAPAAPVPFSPGRTRVAVRVCGFFMVVRLLCAGVCVVLCALSHASCAPCVLPARPHTHAGRRPSTTAWSP
jgi:hypothetical protein